MIHCFDFFFFYFNALNLKHFYLILKAFLFQIVGIEGLLQLFIVFRDFH